MIKAFVLSVFALALAGCSDEQTPEPTDPAQTQSEIAGWVPDRAEGQALYVQTCLVCHQADGSGVPGMQPALHADSSITTDPNRAIEVILRGMGGAETAVPATGDYAMVMPASAHLGDEQIANLVSYIRQEFNGSSPLEPDKVKAVRDRLE
ncbi:MAG: hypothetical protein Phyf2KO_14650 [Phycisphaerales bacterium]